VRILCGIPRHPARGRLVALDAGVYHRDVSPVRAETCVKRLRAVCAVLPEASERPGGEGGRHVAYTVRGRTFGYFTNDHHGDGRLALACKAPVREQAALVAAEPERFFVPPYLGHRGWVGLWLDAAPVDWEEVRELLVESYCLTAPKRLAAAVGA
jgi:hypothetical protein